jgi:hypothetical protein
MGETSPIELSLIYPFRWKVSFHPLAERVERKTLDWLRDIGVVRDESAVDRFRKLTVWAYAGWPFPHGDEKRLETIMGFLALWIFYDDVIEERDDGLLARVKAAVGGTPDLFEKGGPHYRGWWELGQRYGKVMSPAWMIRHADRFEEWVLSVREECRVSNKVRADGVLPKASDHLERRALNIGMIPNVDFIEYQMGWELPAEILRTPEMKALEWVSAEVVAITNDLFSFHKDQRNRWCNLVPCLAQEGRLPLEEAFRRGVDMHNERVLIIDRLGRRLLDKHPEHSELETWLERLHHIMYGFARWHAIASRYNSSFELEEGGSLRLGVREFDDEIRPARRPEAALYA